MENLKKCPFCGSDSGYYMIETVRRDYILLMMSCWRCEEWK